MVMNIADALSAYRQGGGSAKTALTTETSGGESFSDTLKNFTSDAVKSLEEGEKAATAGATGKADIASVVTAINNAELMLQTVVTIRDKVISAYQDITKTAI
ncbi:MAG TPA: flagellar hook-basal body complex protein FliE [Alphaproteobacteria bacterium]|nr:flagellar hook-basal body complex protein FliE [Alphaproteobacteria bacterium]